MGNKGPRSGLIRNWTSASISIANGSSLSGSLLIAGRPIIGVGMPDEWTAGSLSFAVSACENGTFRTLFDQDGVEVALETSASLAIGSGCRMNYLQGWYSMKIRSGSSVDDPDDQGAARTLVIFSQG